MKQLVGDTRKVIRRGMHVVAQIVNRISRGRVTPNNVTWFGFLMHVPIAVAVATDHLILGGILLIVFGLFDSLDGELARLQHRVTSNGGFLDASTDRFKEVLLYSGAAYLLAGSNHPKYAAFAVIACGASISVSYVKAKGEAIVASLNDKIPYTELNYLFAGGLFPFEIRMAVLAVGLLTHQVVIAVSLIAVFATITASRRLAIISKRLQQ
jgi:CDP-diacylglycerol--glycerol-3-phosphate 3-phosphatidyltransferase